MRRSFLNIIRGTIVTALLLLWTILISLTILISALFILGIPIRWWHRKGMAFLLKIPVWWTDLNKIILLMSIHGKIDAQGTGELDPKGWYLMISNHQSWIDILILGNVFNRKIPILKFFMKKELLWTLPLTGLVCYVLGFPFMQRHSRSEIKKRPELRGKDIETTRKACDKFKEFPSTVINFVEGTRFTESKKQRQQSPYQCLLKPKAGGTAIVLNEMRDHLKGIVNVTIRYSNKNLTFWQFLSGDFDNIIVRYDLLPVTDDLAGNYYEDREFRASFQQWLNQLWHQKDAQLQQLENPSHDTQNP